MIDLSERTTISRQVDSLSCFNVFILATGFENSLSPLCENIPKCLIPIVNKPILAYQLEFLERNSFKDVFIISNRKFHLEISTYLNEQYIGNIKTEVIQTNKENLGSIEIFHLIKNKITKNNFILLSGDTIINLNLSQLIDNHILEKPLISVILTKDDQKFLNQKLKYINSEIEISILGIENNSEDTNYRKLAFHKTIYDDNEEKIVIPKTILKKSNNFDLIYNYDDIHMYIFNKAIYKFLDDEKVKNMTLIKADLIPYLINNKDSKKLKTIISDDNSQSLKIMGFMSDTKKNYSYRITSLNKLLNSLSEIQKNFDDIPNIYFYTKNNKRNVFLNFAEQMQDNLDNDRPYFKGLDYIESISIDSYVADPILNISKKSRINKCIIGQNLTLNDNSKVQNSICFDNVRIGKDCKITNCIIGNDVTIGDNCTLTDCVVPHNQKINSESEYTNCTIDE